MQTLDEINMYIYVAFLVSIRWDTYMKPRPNVTMSATFLRGANCRRQTIGIGRMMMTRSIIRLTILVATTLTLSDPQTPGRRGSQFLANGRQIRKAMSVFPTPKDIGNAIVAYAMWRKDLLLPKMEM